MLYSRPSFTLPANSNTRLSQKDWDRAVLSRREFLTKYPPDTVTELSAEGFRAVFQSLCDVANREGNCVDAIKNTDGTLTLPDGIRYRIRA